MICSYTEDRWDRLMAAVESVRAQTLPPQQTIVVVDYNVDLYKRLIFNVDDVVILENTGPKGLSGARNTGAAAATAGVVAFLDDDAVAAPDWLERLGSLYDDPDVLAVGGRVVYEPAALVNHYVPAQRGTLSYMLRRGWSEGISKALVSKIVGHKRALGPERRYVRGVLPRAVASGIAGRIRGTDPAGFRRAMATVAVLAVTTCGYIRGRRLPLVPADAELAPHEPLTSWREVK